MSDGPLDRPRIVDEVPEVLRMVSKPRKPKPMAYEALLETLRAHPGRPAVIARWSTGGKKTTARLSQNAVWEIRGWLDKHHPLESWTLNRRLMSNTYSARELYATFNGAQTIEEHEIDLARRRAAGAKLKAGRDAWWNGLSAEEQAEFKRRTAANANRTRTRKKANARRVAQQRIRAQDDQGE